MEIEMILRDICEYHHVILDAEIAEVIDAMAWCFDNEMCHTHFFCFSDHLPELKRAIHGHLWLIFGFFSSHPYLSCWEETYLSPWCFERSGYQGRSRCFAFRTCDTDDIHTSWWISRQDIGEYTASPMIDDSERTSESYNMAEELKRFHNRAEYREKKASVTRTKFFDKRTFSVKCI